MNIVAMDKTSVKESMLEHWRFYQLPRLVQHNEEKEGRRGDYFFLPALASSFLLLLLIGAASFAPCPTAENGYTMFPTNDAYENTTESWLKHPESWSIPEYTQSIVPFVAPTSTLSENRLPHDWTHGTVTRIVIEICSLALLQSLGLPFAKFLYSSRWWSKGGWRFLVSSARHKFFRQAHRSLWHHRNKSPHLLFQRVLQSIKRVYKRRSRLSAASDITHVMGDDTDKEHKCKQNRVPQPKWVIDTATTGSLNEGSSCVSPTTQTR
ncbi:hypothetical protein MHU86_12248 [Fragilaria crotonensis]|nr:hypothetical protein MHU86_12248 [Fragilaria crotonensis]